MQRSGQCKCGVILTFEQGPAGYKGRCPKCGAIVRLRVAEDPPRPAAGPAGRRPPRPSDPRLSVVALREPGPVAPGEPDPDATAPFEPIDEIALEPAGTSHSANKPAGTRRLGLILALGGIVLVVVAILGALWLRSQ